MFGTKQIADTGKIADQRFSFNLEKSVLTRTLVKAITHQTCLKPGHVYRLLQVKEFEQKILVKNFAERPQPTILQEALTAPDPEALAIDAIQNEWTADGFSDNLSNAKDCKRGPPISGGR